MTVLFQKLLDLIENNAEDITKKCIEEINNHEGLPTYHACDPAKLYRRVFRIYSQLGQWLSKEASVDDVAGWFTAIGEKRFQEGYALSEVIEALVLIKRQLWRKVLKDGLIDNALDLFMTLKLNNDVVLFFDKAFYFVSTGYEQEAAKE